MADVTKNCPNCGNAQTTGDFCERCGTRLPAAGAAPGAVPPPQAAPYQYAAPRQPGPFSKLFDLSFQGFVARGSLRTLYISTMVLLGVFWVLTFIFCVVAAAKDGGWWAVGIFSSLALVMMIFIWMRIMMELAVTVSKLHEDAEKAAQAKAEEAKPKAAKSTATKSTATKSASTK